VEEAICPRCNIGWLIQLAEDSEDVAYCPICGAFLFGYVIWQDKK
jgi:hypothetical protein